MNNNSGSKGIIISISGIDGSGKTTLLGRLNSHYTKLGKETLLTKQPTLNYMTHPLVKDNLSTGRTDAGPEALALLSAFDRLCHISDLKHELSDKDMIFSDRYKLDGIVSFAARGLDDQWVKEINKFCPEPDVSILMNCPGKTAYDRILNRGGEMTYDERSPDILERKRNLLLKYRNRQTLVLDATEDQDYLFKEAVEYIDHYLKKNSLNL